MIVIIVSLVIPLTKFVFSDGRRSNGHGGGLTTPNPKLVDM
jgi:hypothetical protein